jgi:hypothetical protein
VPLPLVAHPPATNRIDIAIVVSVNLCIVLSLLSLEFTTMREQAKTQA